MGTMLTKKDLRAIELLFDVKFDEKFEEKFTEKLKFFPSKDEFYTMIGTMMGELETIRNEQIIITHHHEEFQTRVKALEDIHPNGTHQFAPSA